MSEPISLRKLDTLENPQDHEKYLKTLSTIFERNVKRSDNFYTFNQALKKYKSKDLGNIQEIFAKCWFNAHAPHFNIKKYYSRLLGDEIPEHIKVNKKDFGTDAIIEHNDGKISLVQVKFRKNENNRLQRNAVGNMGLEALPLKNKLQNIFLFSNTLQEPQNIGDHEKEFIKYILYEQLHNSDWNLMKTYVNEKNKNKPTFTKIIFDLRKWQLEAEDFVFTDGTNFGLKSVISPCGAGKSYFGLKILNKKINSEYAYKRCLITVPTLQLLSQWFEKTPIHSPDRRFLLIGSDGPEEQECQVPFKLTTNKEEIEKFLSWDYKDILVQKIKEIAPYSLVDRSWEIETLKQRLEELGNTEKIQDCGYIAICTYQSLGKLMETNPVFDIAVCDEAHLCCGKESSNFTLVTRKNFIAYNKLFLTATPKVYRGFKFEKTIDMSDESIFGKMFIYSYKQAIEDEIISNYKIVLGEGRGKNNDDFDAQFLLKSLKKYNLTSLLVTSSSHAKSKALYEKVKALSEEYGIGHNFILMPQNAKSSDKSRAINAMQSEKSTVIFNVKIFSLGTDIPCLQSIMIIGDRKSVIDIVQTVSRPLRKYKNKEFAYILIPYLLESENFTEDGAFYNVRRILSSLGSVDAALKETIIAKNEKKVGGREIIFDFIGTFEYDFKKEDIEFNLKLFNKLCECREFSPEFKFWKLGKYCEQNKKLPLQNKTFEGVKIGSFLHDLLRDIDYKNQRDEWLKILKNISPEIKNELEKREKNRANEKKKQSSEIKPEKRFEIIKKYCEQNKKLPLQNKTFEGVKIGWFLSSLLRGKCYKDQREEWLKILKNISPEIKNELEKREKNRANEKKKQRSKIKPEKRFEIIKKYCEQNKKLPLKNEIFEGIKIGSFLDKLLTGKCYKDQRDEWLKILKNISPEIKNELEKREKNRANEKKKQSSEIKPEKRFEIIKKYCEQNKKLPVQRKIFEGVQIGGFLHNLLRGKCYKDQREEWLKILKNISPEIKNELEKREKTHTF